MLNLRRAIALAGLVVLAASQLTACKGGSSNSNEILVGEFGSMTGSTATFGQSSHNGIMMAVEEVNAAGGVLGKKIKILLEDDQGKPEEAATAVTKLVNQDKVVAILGEVASSRTMAAAPVAQQNKIPLISPASTN